jgi:hypothetical protein
MSGALQAVFQNQRSFGEPLPTVIGQAYGGGFYAGQIAVGGGGTATHYLIVAPKASGESAKAWKNVSSDTPGADSYIDGPQNTADMVAHGNSTVYPAAHFCNDLVIGGYTDWYMPARNELEVCYYFLKNVTQNNNISSGNKGSNPNAVAPEPISTNYTTTVPAQTTAAAFQVGNSEAFDDGTFWSSTGMGHTYPGTDNAWYQGFYSGAPGVQDVYGKTTGFVVRAVRRVAV